LGESYEALLGLEMIIDINILKYNGQYPKLIYMLAMLTRFFKYISSLTITLRCFQDTLFGLGIDKSLYLMIALSNSSIKRDTHSIIGLSEISFNMLQLI